MTRKPLGVLLLLLSLFVAAPALAEDGAPPPSWSVALDTVWVVLAGMLVFFMNAGFGLLETGLCRAKNAVNILAKNFTVAAFAGLSFFAVGFGLMFADGNALFGIGGALLSGADNSPATGDAYVGVFSSLAWAGIPLEAKFFFQACFAMAAALSTGKPRPCHCACASSKRACSLPLSLAAQRNSA